MENDQNRRSFKNSFCVLNSTCFLFHSIFIHFFAHFFNDITAKIIRLGLFGLEKNKYKENSKENIKLTSSHVFKEMKCSLHILNYC